MRNYINRLLMVALAALALGACQAKEEKLAEHMSRGDQYIDQDEFSAAIIEYKNVLQIDPNHAAAHYGLAKAYPLFILDRVEVVNDNFAGVPFAVCW